jgi:carbamoyltransferase
VLAIGINEGINSSVVVAENGKIVFALQEERVKRVKNFMGFPHQALQFTLRYLNLNPKDVDVVCLSNNQSAVWTKEAFLTWYDHTADDSATPMQEGDIDTLARRLYRAVVPESIRKVRYELGKSSPNELIEQQLAKHGLARARVIRSHHHANHAASAYYGLRQNPVEPHLVLTLDGSGDQDVSHVYVGENGRLRLIASTPWGNSIGNIYARVTHLMGMTPHEHEYKIMGLAAYCDKKHAQPVAEIFRGYLDLDPDDLLRFKRKISEPTSVMQPRLVADLKRIRFDNLAGGLQLYTEDLLVRWVKHAMQVTGIRKVVAAGGVFMNVKANKAISEIPEIEYFDVFPSCGDESLPFGAVWKHYAETSSTNRDDISFGSYNLGPDPGYDFENAKMEYRDRLGFSALEDPELTAARLVAEGKIVARCSGPMEFGARALGNRSILADPKSHEVIPEINRMIKQRDFWMPFAPAVLLEDVGQYLRVPPQSSTQQDFSVHDAHFRLHQSKRRIRRGHSRLRSHCPRPGSHQGNQSRFPSLDFELCPNHQQVNHSEYVVQFARLPDRDGFVRCHGCDAEL